MVDEEDRAEDCEETLEKKPTWVVVLRKGMAKEVIAWIIVLVAYWIYCRICG